MGRRSLDQCVKDLGARVKCLRKVIETSMIVLHTGVDARTVLFVKRRPQRSALIIGLLGQKDRQGQLRSGSRHIHNYVLMGPEGIENEGPGGKGRVSIASKHTILYNR